MAPLKTAKICVHRGVRRCAAVLQGRAFVGLSATVLGTEVCQSLQQRSKEALNSGPVLGCRLLRAGIASLGSRVRAPEPLVTPTPNRDLGYPLAAASSLAYF